MKVKCKIYMVFLIGLPLLLMLNCKKEEPVKTIPIITLSAVTDISATSATSGGAVTDDGGASIISRGVCWSLNQSPTISDSKTENGSGTGSFTSSITGLAPGITYNIRSYATNSVGTGYSSSLSFTTLALAPVLTTADLTSITSISVSGGGNITNDGGSPVTARGVCWSTNQNPTIADGKTTNGTGAGSFTSAITGLTPGTTYYFRAYATNSIGTTYGNQLTTATQTILSVLTTTDISALTSTTATSGGSITTNGGGITARGVCFSINQNPTILDNFTVDGTGAGQFVSQLINLLPGTTYYVRAYATNSAGTGFGAQITFTTPKGVPIVTTKDITEISAMGGISGGIITSSGGSPISAKGICWGEFPNPTLNDNVISSGTGQLPFNSSIVSAVPGTIYYVRAYAKNEAGTGYGDQKTFTALGNVNYYSFESGMLPTGWGGQWTVSNSNYFVGNYCLKSTLGVTTDATLTSTLSNSGKISFYYLLNWSGTTGFTTQTSIDFYIDNVLISHFISPSTWNFASFDISAGTHSFMWRFNQSYGGGQGFIDYLIFPK